MRFTTKIAAAMLLGTLGGCTLIDTQTALVDQARGGVALAQSALDDREQLAAESFDQQRRRLDAAFDEDVVERSTRAALDATWVIEHRKAYAVGLDALAAQRQSWADRLRADHDNLAATDEALQQIRALQELQGKLIR